MPAAQRPRLLRRATGASGSANLPAMRLPALLIAALFGLAALLAWHLSRRDSQHRPIALALAFCAVADVTTRSGAASPFKSPASRVSASNPAGISNGRRVQVDSGWTTSRRHQIPPCLTITASNRRSRS